MYFILDPFSSLETHLLLRRPICFFGDPFASSETHLLLRRPICFFRDPFASSETHLLLQRPICFFGDPFASSETHLLLRKPFIFHRKPSHLSSETTKLIGNHPCLIANLPYFIGGHPIFDIYLSRNPVEDLVDERDQGIVLQEEQLPTGVQVRK